MEIIRGCELGVQGQYGEIHLLGLWLPRHSAPLDAELARLRGHREERNLKILDRLRSIGINIGYQEVLDEAGGESVGRPHIARVLQKRGIVSNFVQAFGAIEAYHSEHSARDERFCVELAARYGLGLSGGSDYHGMAKPGVELGRGKGGLRVTVALLDALKARRKRPVDDAPEVL